jgi:hypothetical protein
MKPCIECGKDCDILPVQLGDFFTLTYLRVCSPECMFLVAYEFMRDIGEHKQFRNKLWELQNEEDKALRTNHVDEVTQESLRSMREHFEKCPDLLSRPVPNLVSDLFKSAPTISSNCGQTMRFTRPTSDEVKEIRKKLKLGQLGSELAKEYNVCPMQISRIKNRKEWNHLE